MRKIFEIMCHSAVVRCLVNGWLKSVIHHTNTVKSRALAEILIRRRLDTLKEMIEEEEICVMALSLLVCSDCQFACVTC